MVPAEELGNLAEAAEAALLGTLGMAAMAALRAVALVELRPQALAVVAVVALEERQLLLFLALKVAVVLVSLGKVATGLLAHTYKVLAALAVMEQHAVLAVHTEGGHRPLAAAIVLEEQLALVVVDYVTQTISL